MASIGYHLTHFRFMLVADKSGMAHLLGRRNQNYEFFSMFCDCDGHKLYDLSMDAMLHYDRLTYAVRLWRGLGVRAVGVRTCARASWVF